MSAVAIPGLQEWLAATHIFLNICIIYGLYLGLVALHEAGHWIGAISCGFPISEFRVGLLRWLAASGWSIQMRPRFIFTGLVVALPNGLRRGLRRRYLTFVLTGPLASILGGVIGLILFTSQTIHSSVLGFVAYCSAGSILLGAINLIPAQGRELRSDGMRFFEVLSAKGFRVLQFRTSYIESKDDLLESLRTKDYAQAKRILEAILGFSEGVPETDEMMKAIRKVMALIGRQTTDGLASSA